MTIPTASATRDQLLSSQLQAFDSTLALASELNLASSAHHDQDSTRTPPTLLPRSIQTAQLIIDTAATQRQLAEMETQLRTIQKHQLAGNIKSISMDDRLRCLSGYADQLLLLQENRIPLIHKLSQPRVAEHILMEHQYHKDFVNLFRQIQNEVPEVQRNLDAMTWKDELLGSTRELEQLRSGLDELTEMSVQQNEIADASQRLHLNLMNVLRRSSSSKLAIKRKN